MKSVGNLKVAAEGDREVLITRTFDAKRALVWQAMSQPAFIKRWLAGPPGWEMITCVGETRVGEAFRWVWRNADGNEMVMHGVYREVTPPERIVRTEVFEMGCDSQSFGQLATLVLADEGEKTGLTINVLYPSKEARDATLASGMERGIAASYDRLDEVLALPE